MNLYNLHNDPKSLHGHGDPAVEQLIKLQHMIAASEFSDDDMDVLLDHIKDNVHNKNFIQALTKLLNTLGQTDQAEFLWILEQLPDSVVNAFGNVKPAKKKPQQMYSINRTMNERIKNNKVLKHLLSNLDFRLYN